MASGWASFRKHWIKPEVYPLIGAMAAALGVCATAMINKARDPTVGWNKSKRKHDLYEDVEEVVPLWSSAKNNSTRIFGSSKDIVESNKLNIAPLDPITVKLGDDEEEQEEEDTPVEEEQSTVTEEQASPSQSQSSDSVASDGNVVIDVIDEPAEIINAAIDAATESSENALKSDVTEQTAASITHNPPSPQNVQPTAAQS